MSDYPSRERFDLGAGGGSARRGPEVGLTVTFGITHARMLCQMQLADAVPRRWRHVQAVAAAADFLAGGLNCDRVLLVSAAWLHDIGYSPTITSTGFHPLDGARFLRHLGWPDAVCALVAYHTCARVEGAHRGLAAQMTAEFVDTASIERDALWTADATIGPDGESLTLEQRVNEVAQRYGPAHLVSQCMHEIRPRLATAIARTAARGLLL